MNFNFGGAAGNANIPSTTAGATTGSGFNFGATSPNNNAISGFSFGGAPKTTFGAVPTSTPNIGFGLPQQTTQTSLFGAKPAASAAPTTGFNFGQQPAQNIFGLGVSSPNTQSIASPLTMGAKPATATVSAFGSPTSATSTPIFGQTTTAATSAPAGISSSFPFGGGMTMQPTSSFATTSAPAFGSNTAPIGATATTSTPVFGGYNFNVAPATQQGFGTSSSTSIAAPPPPASQTNTTVSMPTFGSSTLNPLNSATPMFGFGTTPAPNTAVVSPQVAPAASVATFGSNQSTMFGKPAAVSTPSFGITNLPKPATTAQPVSGFGTSGGSYSFGQTSGAQPIATVAASTPNIASNPSSVASFGSTLTAAKPPEFSFGNANRATPPVNTVSATTTPAPTGFGGFQIPKTSQTQSPGLTLTSTTAEDKTKAIGASPLGLPAVSAQLQQPSIPAAITVTTTPVTTTAALTALPAKAFQLPAASTATSAAPLAIPPVVSQPVTTNVTAAAAAAATIAATVAATTAVPAQPTPATSMNFGQLEDAINKWSLELEEQEKVFINQATQVNAWDKLLIANGEKIVSLNESLQNVRAEQQSLDHELDFILGQQRELEELLIPLEKELGNVVITDPEREHTYRLADNIDTQVKQMSEDLKEIIEHLNESNRKEDNNDPIVQIGRILNAHMSSMEWIDHSTAKISSRLDFLSNMNKDLKRQNQRSGGLFNKF